MELVLVAPGILALPNEALARERTLSRIAGSSQPVVVDDLDRALIETLGANLPSAPLAATGAGVTLTGRFAIRADPVTMRVTHDDVRIAARVDDLDSVEAQALAALLDAHFAVEGLGFLAPRSDTWFATSEAAHEIATTPLDAAVGRALRPCLPTGRDAARWRRWLNETQMLLHGHPLGAREHPVNGLWFSGGGVIRREAPNAAAASTRFFATEGRDGDVARGLARLGQHDALGCRSVADAIAVAVAEGTARLVIVLPRAEDGAGAAAACAAATEGWSALERGALERLDLVADGRGVAATWSTSRPSLWRRIAPRSAPFLPPERSE